MQANYTTPLAKWARVLEIFIPGYMFGKAWGMGDEVTVDLFRVTFPPFLIDMAEFFKRVLSTDNTNLQRLFATSAGAIVGFLVIAVLAVIMHFILRDRKYVDSLRFTSVTLIPLALMNGTLTHLTTTLLEQLGGGENLEKLTRSALVAPRGQIFLFVVFYLTSLWMFGKRTGVKGGRRWGVVIAGVGVVAVYLSCGLMITAEEWALVLPKLQAALAAH